MELLSTFILSQKFNIEKGFFQSLSFHSCNTLKIPTLPGMAAVRQDLSPPPRTDAYYLPVHPNAHSLCATPFRACSLYASSIFFIRSLSPTRIRSRFFGESELPDPLQSHPYLRCHIHCKVPTPPSARTCSDSCSAFSAPSVLRQAPAL